MPPLFFFGVWVIGPTFYTIYLSFTDANMISSPHFVGMYNYKVLFSDPIFHRCLVNNVIWMIIYLLIPIPVAFAIALGLEERLKGANVLRVIFYLPMAISLIAVSLIWAWMYNPEWGVINTVLRKIGLESLTRLWLGEPSIALYSVIFASCWNFIPLLIIIFNAGLTNIPREVIEASQIDGTSYFQQVRYVVLPLLRPTFTISMIITVIFSLRTFDVVFAMTGGGPANASNVLANFMFKEAFGNTLLGYGSSIAVILCILTLAFIAVYLRQILGKEAFY
jgi:multiple sugar transport system permease protein